MSEVQFRPMQKGDVARVAELERLCFRTPWSEASLAGELKNRLASYRVGELEGRVVTYGGMWIFFDEAHITNVAVDPEYRKRGIGHELMREMMRAAVLRGAEKMSLEVRVTNEAAQRLYASIGFVAEGRRKKYYSDTGEDALILWCYDIAKRIDNEN